METPKAKAIMTETLANTSWLDKRDRSYWLRLKNNHHVLLEVCKALREHGVICYTARDEYEGERTHYVVGYKDDQKVEFGFSEVPYRWYVGNSYDNSCCRGLVGERGYDYPFEVDEILAKLRPCNNKELERKKDRQTSQFYIEL